MTMANWVAPDGYRWGVMFQDGSVYHHWTGVTQRTRAEEYLEFVRDKYPGEHITLARRIPGDLWERVE